MITRKPDYHLPVTIESQIDTTPKKKGIILKNIPCQIFLPENAHEDVMAYLELNDGQAEIIGEFGHLFWQMSIRGWLRWGGTFTQVQANKCYIPNGQWPMRRYGCSFQRINLPLEVLDLQIVDVHQIGQKGIIDKGFGKGNIVKKPYPLPTIEEPNEPSHVTFWLTNNRDLLTGRTEISHQDGSIEVESFEPYKFDLLPGVEVTFECQFRWDSNVETGQHDRRKTLVANVSLPTKGTKPFAVDDSILCALDDFLLLISFATRWNTICLGWNISQWPYLTKSYRHGRTLPSHLQNSRYSTEQDYETGLISPRSLPEFLRRAWPAWTELDAPLQEMLNHVLQATVHAQSLDLHAGFISHYATLEMMILHFRRTNDLEFVLSDGEEWNKFHSELKEFITKQSILAGSSPQQKAKRKRAYEKLCEFNRVAFGTVFDEFCIKTALPAHQDLWPVDGKKSLSWIRNNLVHGVLDGRDQANAIWIAKSHLEWWVERSILCLLSWPIEKSRVKPGYLSNLSAYNTAEWEAAKNVLFP